MQLDNLMVTPRLRKPWAALDVGVLIARRYWWRYMLLWLLCATPFFVISSLLFQDNLWLVTIIIWWCKPIFERPVLYMLSRNFFQQTISVKQIFKEVKQWLLPGVLWSLTLRRLSPLRSTFMPIVLLERLSGKAYSQRTGVLGRKVGSESFWLLIVLVHVEYFFSLSMILFIDNIYTLNIWDQLSSSDQGLLFITITNLTTLLSMAVIAPFYVACGFMLYVNRRIELEGWDIEICFRDLAAKQRVVKHGVS